MSIEVYVYLGKRIAGLEKRVVERLKSHDFEIEFPPGVDLLQTAFDETLAVAIHKLPQNLRRKEPDTSLLAGFGYYVNGKSSSSQEWKPKGVKSYDYSIYTRTSSGRSMVDGLMQYLLTSAVAYESEGKVWVNGDDVASIGKHAFDEALAGWFRMNGEVDIGSMIFSGWPNEGQKFNWPTNIIEPHSRPEVSAPQKKAWWKFWISQ